jgi:hypothetical protein
MYRNFVSFFLERTQLESLVFAFDNRDGGANNGCERSIPKAYNAATTSLIGSRHGTCPDWPVPLGLDTEHCLLFSL